MLRARVRSSGRTLGGLLVALTLSLVVLAAVMNRQYLVDQFTLWQYKPDGQIASMVERTGMSDKGMFYFYVSSPTLDNANSFNKNCANTDPEGATLGCYSGGKIYIYDVNDQRLDGIREVTAAHEMLHAVYERKNVSEKATINDMLDVAYEKVKDAKLAERMDMYERTQPGTRYTELHSIIGTEYKTLPMDLEAYYENYFQDRAKVVDLYASYYGQFKALSDRSDQLSAEIDVLSATLKSESAAYNKEIESLTDDINDFNSQPSNLSAAQRAQLSAERSLLLARVSAVEASKARINEMIDKYNSLVDEYNSVNNESTSLYRSIDSSLAPTPSL